MSEKLIRFDWAIKRLLRSKANFDILEGFLSELLNRNIVIKNILESEGNQDDKNDKFNRVDILVEDEKNDLILIEVQVNREADFLSRMLYGTSSLISEYMKLGDSYSKVKKVYSVNILYFDLGYGDDYVYYGKTDFIGVHSKNILELNYKQKIVYDKNYAYEVYPEYYIIKVNNFDDVAKNNLDEWIYFLKNEEIKDNFSAKGLKEAKEKLDIMKMSEEDQENYKRFLKNLHYESSMIENSKVENTIDIAKKLKKLNVEDDVIIKSTGLTKEDLIKIFNT